MAQPPKKEPRWPTIDEATAALEQFFFANAQSKIEISERNELFIVGPWNDESLSLRLVQGDDFDGLAAVLNSVLLPERFSAILHRAERKLEVIWSALKLPESQQEIQKRKFDFTHRGKTHKCWFGKSSDALLAIARYAQPQTISKTNYRNLASFTTLALGQGEVDRFDYPKSFWIENVDWDEDALIDLLRHLNFYMTYFDVQSPTVLIHSRVNEPMVPKRTRYIRGNFPGLIEAKSLDENVLSFWSFADDGNPMLRFLLYYRILEYAAVHHINEEARQALKKILVAPDMRSNLDEAMGAITGILSPVTKLADSQRLRALFRTVIDPALMFRDLKANREFFSKNTEFDGGFSVKAPIGKNDTDNSFDAKAVENLADRFREIRNALSHGKDQETAGVIRPTPENVEKFRPWVHLIATAAGEVVLYQAAT